MKLLRWFSRPRKHKIQVVKGDADMWFSRIVSTTNGQTTHTSQVYRSHSSLDMALQTAESVAKDAGWKVEVL